MVQCKTINEKAIARAEYVIEGELSPDVRVREDQTAIPVKQCRNFRAIPALWNQQSRWSKSKQLPTAATQSYNPASVLPKNTSIWQVYRLKHLSRHDGKSTARQCQNVYAHCSGGGKYGRYPIRQKAPPDEGCQRQVSLLAFCFLGTETRYPGRRRCWSVWYRRRTVGFEYPFQGDVDVITIPGVRPPSARSFPIPRIFAFDPRCRYILQTIFDCTVPFGLKEHFQRGKEFKEVDPAKWVPELFKNNSKENTWSINASGIFLYTLMPAASLPATVCVSGLTSCPKIHTSTGRNTPHKTVDSRLPRIVYFNTAKHPTNRRQNMA